MHIGLLDSYLFRTEGKKYKDKLESYKQEYGDMLNVTAEYENINERKKELDNKRSFLEFQLKEILDVNPLPNEDEGLDNELRTLENIEGIQQGLSSAYSNLYDDEGSAVERIKTVEKELSKIGEYNTDVQKILKDISESSHVLNEGPAAAVTNS